MSCSAFQAAPGRGRPLLASLVPGGQSVSFRPLTGQGQGQRDRLLVVPMGGLNDEYAEYQSGPRVKSTRKTLRRPLRCEAQTPTPVVDTHAGVAEGSRAPGRSPDSRGTQLPGGRHRCCVINLGPAWSPPRKEHLPLGSDSLWPLPLQAVVLWRCTETRRLAPHPQRRGPRLHCCAEQSVRRWRREQTCGRLEREAPV